MKIRGFALLFALFTPCVVTNAQTFSETVEVRVTNVEAVVTDKSGKPVGGLSKDDFEIFEDGVRQEISNFDEIRESFPSGALTTTGTQTETPAAPEPRYFRRRLVTVFIDNASLAMGNRNAVLPQLRRFIKENIRPGDALGIYVWGNNLRAELDPTSDPAEISAAVDRLATRTAGDARPWRDQFEQEIEALIIAYKSRKPPETPDIGIGVGIAGSYAARAMTEIRQKTAALESVIASLKGAEGRKVLVLLTESMSSNPGTEAFMYLDSIKEEFAGTAHYHPFSESRIYELPGLADSIAAAANSAGVTLYPINAAGKFTDSSHIDASRRPGIFGGPMMNTNTSTATLFQIANDTGGAALAGSSNWQLAFDTISNDLNIYYSLGYRTSGPRQDRLKRVEVRLKNKRGLTVRTRKSIVEKTAASEMSDAVTANLFQNRPTNDLAIKAVTGPATTTGEALVYPASIVIPTNTLTLVAEGTDLVGNITIFAAFLRADGAVSRVGRQTQQFRFPADSLSRRKEITVKLDVTADATTNAISFGVMDETSRATGFALVQLKP